MKTLIIMPLVFGMSLMANMGLANNLTTSPENKVKDLKCSPFSCSCYVTAINNLTPSSVPRVNEKNIKKVAPLACAAVPAVCPLMAPAYLACALK